MTASKPKRPDAAALLLALLCSIPSFFDLSFFASGIGIALLVLLPAMVFSIAQRRFIVDDPIPLIGVVWIVGVTLPALFPDRYLDRLWTTLPIWSIEQAALWMYRAWAATTVTYWLVRMFQGRQNDAEQKPDGSGLLAQTRMRRLIGLVGASGCAASMIYTKAGAYTFVEIDVADSSLLQVINLLASVSVIYVYLYFYARGRETLGRLDHYILYANLTIQTLIFITAGSKAVAISLAAAWALGSSTGARRIGLLREIAIAVVSVTAIIVISYVVTAYREEVRMRGVPENAGVVASISFQVDAMGASINDLLAGKELGDPNNPYGANAMLDRFAASVNFAQVLYFANGEPPYENPWASLATPVLALTPRSVIDTKVHFVNSGDFARMNGWSFGGLSLTVPGSLFWAWGYIGIVAAMSAMGFGLAVLAKRAESYTEVGIIYRSVLISLVISMLNIGIEFQPIMATTTRLFLLLILIRLATYSLTNVFGTDDRKPRRPAAAMLHFPNRIAER